MTRSRGDNTSATISNVDLYSNKFPCIASKAEYTVQKWIVPYLYLRTCFIFSIRLCFFFSIEFHLVHAFDTFFVGGNALAYHLIKPFQSSRLSMKNKPTEKERKKKIKKGKKGTARRVRRHRDAYAITSTERFKFSPNYWAVFHVVRASKFSPRFPFPLRPYFSLRLNLLFPYLFPGLLLFFSSFDYPFPAAFEIKVDRVSKQPSTTVHRS